MILTREQKLKKLQKKKLESFDEIGAQASWITVGLYHQLKFPHSFPFIESRSFQNCL